MPQDVTEDFAETDISGNRIPCRVIKLVTKATLRPNTSNGEESDSDGTSSRTGVIGESEDSENLDEKIRRVPFKQMMSTGSDVSSSSVETRGSGNRESSSRSSSVSSKSLESCDESEDEAGSKNGERRNNDQNDRMFESLARLHIADNRKGSKKKRTKKKKGTTDSKTHTCQRDLNSNYHEDGRNDTDERTSQTDNHQFNLSDHGNIDPVSSDDETSDTASSENESEDSENDKFYIKRTPNEPTTNPYFKQCGAVNNWGTEQQTNNTWYTPVPNRMQEMDNMYEENFVDLETLLQYEADGHGALQSNLTNFHEMFQLYDFQEPAEPQWSMPSPLETSNVPGYPSTMRTRMENQSPSASVSSLSASTQENPVHYEGAGIVTGSLDFIDMEFGAPDINHTLNLLETSMPAQSFMTLARMEYPSSPVSSSDLSGSAQASPNYQQGIDPNCEADLVKNFTSMGEMHPNLSVKATDAHVYTNGIGLTNGDMYDSNILPDADTEYLISGNDGRRNGLPSNYDNRNENLYSRINSDQSNYLATRTASNENVYSPTTSSSSPSGGTVTCGSSLQSLDVTKIAPLLMQNHHRTLPNIASINPAAVPDIRIQPSTPKWDSEAQCWSSLTMPRCSATDMLKRKLKESDVRRVMEDLFDWSENEFCEPRNKQRETYLMQLVKDPVRLQAQLGYLLVAVTMMQNRPESLTLINTEGHDALYLAAINCPNLPFVAGYLAACIAKHQRHLNTYNLDQRDTLLHIIASKGDSHEAVLEELLSLNESLSYTLFDVMKPNSSGKTPLHVALEVHTPEGTGISTIGIIGVLMKNGADLGPD